METVFTINPKPLNQTTEWWQCVALSEQLAHNSLLIQLVSAASSICYEDWGQWKLLVECELMHAPQCGLALRCPVHCPSLELWPATHCFEGLVQ